MPHYDSNGTVADATTFGRIFFCMLLSFADTTSMSLTETIQRMDALPYETRGVLPRFNSTLTVMT